MSTIHLPLTTTADRPVARRAPGLTEQVIGAIVDDFYASCRADPLLGPIFTAHITDWEPHLAVIREFWAAALLGTGRYSGRPIEAHRQLPLQPAHFGRWLGLWNQAVRRHAEGEDARVAIEAAASMARAIIQRMEGHAHRATADRPDRALP